MIIHIAPLVIATVSFTMFVKSPEVVVTDKPRGGGYILTPETPRTDTSTFEIESLKRRVEDLEGDVNALQKSLHSVVEKLLEERQQAESIKTSR